LEYGYISADMSYIFPVISSMIIGAFVEDI